MNPLPTRTPRWPALALFGAGAALLAAGVHAAGRAADDAAREGAESLQRELRTALPGAAASFATFVASTRSGGATPPEVHRVRIAPPEPEAGAPAEALSLEFGRQDAQAAKAEYARHGDSPAALRELARLERAAGENESARQHLLRARELAPRDSRLLMLIEHDLGDASGVRARIERGEFAAVSPRQRADLHAVCGGEPERRAHLVALARLQEGRDQDRVVWASPTRLAWRIAEAADQVTLAVAPLPDLFATHVPAWIEPGEGSPRATLDPPWPDVPVRLAATMQQVPALAARGAFWPLAALGALAALLCWLAAFLFVRHARHAKRLRDAEQSFLCAVTHELKTPVGNIRLFADTIRAHGAADPAQVPRFAEIIGVEAERLRARIDELLLIASGQLIERAERCDVAELITEVVASHAQSAAARGMTLARDCAGSLHVHAPKALLARAVGNLVDNAVKFAGRGTITVAAMRHGSSVKITVTDQGPGIPAAERERVFEPFVRLGDALARDQQGTGLGLTLVRRIVQDLGGSARADAGRDGGACVTISLPSAAP